MCLKIWEAWSSDSDIVTSGPQFQTQSVAATQLLWAVLVAAVIASDRQ